MPSNPDCVSTGRLPDPVVVRDLVSRAHARFLAEDGGRVADYIPALAAVSPNLFGICVAATLANGGVNPLTREHVIDAVHCEHVLAVMVTAGLYESSGDWLYKTGLPGKSGVSGCMITVAPGKGALATFSPPLDGAGNSVRGQLTARLLSAELGLNLFASRPAGPPNIEPGPPRSG